MRLRPFLDKEKNISPKALKYITSALGFSIGIIYFTSAYYHDSAACLFQDGKLVFACEEEKFTGIKHDSSFPESAIQYIKDNYTDKFDVVCYYEKPHLKLLRALKHNWSSIPRILWTSIKAWV